MSEKPILFSGYTVQVTLDGQKTQTRRVIRPQPGDWITNVNNYYGSWMCGGVFNGGFADGLLQAKNPYGDPGDRLWVRETAWYGPQPDRVEYDADMDDIARESALFYGAKKKPSIYMPRWASRITLLIKDVRVERLQDITQEDARSEGVIDTGNVWGELSDTDRCGPRGAFKALWDSINAKRGYGWDTNPWVWVIEFEKMD